MSILGFGDCAPINTLPCLLGNWLVTRANSLVKRLGEAAECADETRSLSPGGALRALSSTSPWGNDLLKPLPCLAEPVL